MKKTVQKMNALVFFFQKLILLKQMYGDKKIKNGCFDEIIMGYCLVSNNSYYMPSPVSRQDEPNLAL